jgi:hypothetical protein
MKIKKLFSSILFLTALLVAAPFGSLAQTFSEKRVESKSFRLKPGTMVQVYNKYGNVNIMPWDKDSVRFVVSIAAQSKQETKIRKILSSIDCEMISTARFISARTVFHDNSTTFWKDVVSYAGKVINSGNNLQIDYTVYMPVNHPLKVENKFGNIYMGNHKANVDISLSNGDLQARDFLGNLKLDLEFGSASLQDIEKAQLDINYSDLSLQNVKLLTLTSRSSTFDFDKASSLELNSTRDKINIRTCETLSGDASFSRIKINSLETNCTITAKYGEFKLNGISRNFRTIYIKTEFTDVLLGMNPQSAYSADLLYDAKTTLSHQNSRDKLCLCGSKKVKHIDTLDNKGSHIVKAIILYVPKVCIPPIPTEKTNASEIA